MPVRIVRRRILIGKDTDMKFILVLVAIAAVGFALMTLRRRSDAS